MHRTKANKNALIMSIISLLLCAAMFVSTTFAWFTDSITSANNKIVAGSLQVDLEVLEKDGSWTSIKESGKAIFDYGKWEPGYTDVKILRVVNKGTLTLQWMTNLVADYELTGLADVIDVYIKHDITAYPRNERIWQSGKKQAQLQNSLTRSAPSRMATWDQRKQIIWVLR